MDVGQQRIAPVLPVLATATPVHRNVAALVRRARAHVAAALRARVKLVSVASAHPVLDC